VYSEWVRIPECSRSNSGEKEIHMSLRTVRFFWIAAGCVFVAAAQNQPQAYVVDTCVKAAPGKGLETSAYIREVLAKTAQVRVDEGTAAWYLALTGCGKKPTLV
jgi:hypothetical protein